MASRTLSVGIERGSRKTFIWATDWPGWCRAGRDLELATAALLAHAPRYGRIAERAGLTFPTFVASPELDIVDDVRGNGGTDFGVPSIITDDDRRRLSAEGGDRRAAIVRAAWAELDAVAASAPASLRKGPRGGGRDRDAVIEHVVGADHAYAREIGLRIVEATAADRPSVRAQRAAVLERLGGAHPAGPFEGRRWTPRYAARRIAWHTIDHIWEIEDRSGPG
jgi:hypothetical protein